MTATRTARAKNFQKCYQRLIAAAGPYQQTLRQIVERSAVINYEHRMTGNGVINVVDEIIKMKDDLGRADLQGVMDRFIESQVLVPGEWKPNRPSTYSWMYSSSAVMELVPAPPEPHDTYDPSTDYVI